MISAVAAIALARPEAGFSSSSNSYSAPSGPSSSYSAPSSNYGAPAPQYGAPLQQPTVHKHVYVHVPPPEPEYRAPHKPIEFAPPQKHYKIIFIKVWICILWVIKFYYFIFV